MRALEFITGHMIYNKKPTAESHLYFVINFYIIPQAMEQQLKGGAMPRAWYREHAHPVLLPLDEEENHLLR